jgi:hypothetical protein
VNPAEAYVLKWAPWNGRVALELRKPHRGGPDRQDRAIAASYPKPLSDNPAWRADARPFNVYTRDSDSARWTRYRGEAPLDAYSFKLDGKRVLLQLGPFAPEPQLGAWERAVREGITVANLGINANLAGRTGRGYRRKRRNT